eukprot:3548153-Ditylum_brightwellii.AAC.1
MASFFVGWLTTVVIRALNRSIVDDTLDALVARGDREVLKVAHHMHDTAALFDRLFDLVFDKRIEILDLFACQAVPFGPPFGILNKPDLPEPLLLCNTVRGLNVLPAGLYNVALVCVM